MEQLGMSSKDLWKIVKYKSRATEILNRKRKLTLWMIRSISNALNISPKILIKDYPLAV
jgi:HTH-type transcriptional regulator/antitoxin HigA